MTRRARALVVSCALILALVVAAPGMASVSPGTITGSNTFESCFAGSDGTCSTIATAGPDGAFGGAVELSSPDSPLSRSTRYSQSLARYTIGFDLPSPARELEIKIRVVLDRAEAMWLHDHPEVFGGATSPRSGAKVLFQLLGHSAPSSCGCGWFGQGSADVVAAEVTQPQRQRLVSSWPVELTMTATNPFGNGLLPAGHYEVLLRGYALAELAGSGDWGTLSASMDGRIQSITVSAVPDEVERKISHLTLSVSGTGSSRALTATLTDDDSVPLDGRTITFYGDGETLGTAVTENGVATLPVSGKFRGGSRTFTATFAGDDAYEGASAEARS